MKTKIVILLVMLVGFMATNLAKAFVIGDRVQANGTVNVRQTPAGTILGTQNLGSQGSVGGGPTVASLNGTSYTWYSINFDAGVDGWVADIGLTLVPNQTPTQSSINQYRADSAPIHERALRVGRLAKTKRMAFAQCSWSMAIWKSVVVT